MPIEIKDATQANLDYVRLDPISDSVKRYPMFELNGWAKAAFVNGECIAVGGVVKYWDGMGEGWMQLSKKVDHNKIEVVRLIRRIIEMAFKELSLRRLQMIARVDFEQMHKLSVHLGFQQECVLRKYAPDGADVIMYSIVR